jgi:hypothetical protein
VVLTPRRWCQVGGGNSACDGVNKPITGESTKETVKTIARGMSGETDVTVVTTLVCFFTLHTRLRAHRAPGIPCSLWSFRGRFPAKLEHNLLARSRSHVLERHHCNTADNSPNTRADIGVSDRYINAARHVRAFGVWMGIAR